MWHELSWKPPKISVADAEVHGQIVADLPSSWAKETIIIAAILVVIHVAAAEGELRVPRTKILEIPCFRRSICKKKLAIEYLREELVEKLRA